MRLQRGLNAFLCIENSGNIYSRCKCGPISVKRNLRTEANVIVCECATYYHALAYYTIISFLLRLERHSVRSLPG